MVFLNNCKFLFALLVNSWEIQTYTKNETQGTQCKVPNDKLSFPMEDYFQVFSQAAVLANSYVNLLEAKIM